MSKPFPQLTWDRAEFHRQLLTALDESFDELSRTSTFSSDWTSWRTVAGTKTQVRQSPMLGNGASDRNIGGFVRFAQRYATAEATPDVAATDRCSFERYQDFAFYTANNWYDGKRHSIVIAECESNPNELLGELSGLISVRCPHKYLFIHGNDTLNRLNSYCNDADSHANDWANTTYYVIEIPDSPSRPSTWLAYVANIENNGDPLRFQAAR